MQEPGKPPTVPLVVNTDCAKSSGSTATQQIDAACQMIAAGRIAASQLAVHAKSFGLSETEFRLLWLLRAASPPLPTDQTSLLFDQKAMGKRLGLSPAQVSAVVERLRKESLLSGQASPADRRRQVWQLTAGGITLLEKSIAKYASTDGNRDTPPAPNREDAA